MYEAQTVDPVKHGHWVKSLDHYDSYMCSGCGHLTTTESDNYCSGCGTKMDEVKVNNSKGIDLWMTEEQFNSIYEMEEVEDEL